MRGNSKSKSTKQDIEQWFTCAQQLARDFAPAQVAVYVSSTCRDVGKGELHSGDGHSDIPVAATTATAGSPASRSCGSRGPLSGSTCPTNATWIPSLDPSRLFSSARYAKAIGTSLDQLKPGHYRQLERVNIKIRDIYKTINGRLGAPLPQDKSRTAAQIQWRGAPADNTTSNRQLPCIAQRKASPDHD